MHIIYNKTFRFINGLLKKRFFSYHNKNREGFKVAVIGAASQVGQTLSMFLKHNNLISELNLFDNVPTVCKIAEDLSHIASNAIVNGHHGKAALHEYLWLSNIVVITNGYSETPIIDQKELLKKNSKRIKNVIPVVALACPDALIAIAADPVNITVPITSAVLQQYGISNPKRLFGVTNLNTLRARHILAEQLSVEPQNVHINIIGGNSKSTLIPILSKANPKFGNFEDQIESITKKIQEANHNKSDILQHSYTVSYAISNFVNSLLRALNNEPNIVECPYIESYITDSKYFASPVELTECGLKNILRLPRLTKYEAMLLDKVIPVLQDEIDVGLRIGGEIGFWKDGIKELKFE